MNENRWTKSKTWWLDTSQLYQLQNSKGSEITGKVEVESMSTIWQPFGKDTKIYFKDHVFDTLKASYMPYMVTLTIGRSSILKSMASFIRESFYAKRGFYYKRDSIMLSQLLCLRENNSVRTWNHWAPLSYASHIQISVLATFMVFIWI